MRKQLLWGCTLVVILLNHSPSVCEKLAQFHTVQGKVYIKSDNDHWITATKVVVDGGRFHGFLKEDGSFKIHNVPCGSYIVEVVSANHWFEPARVDISSKSGKIRALKVDFINPKNISRLPYPLEFRADGQAKFFEKREQWNTSDILRNPMLLTAVPMVLLLLLVTMLPSKPADIIDSKKLEEMDSWHSLRNMLSLEEIFTNIGNWLTGKRKTDRKIGTRAKKSKKPKSKPPTAPAKTTGQPPKRAQSARDKPKTNKKKRPNNKKRNKF